MSTIIPTTCIISCISLSSVLEIIVQFNPTSYTVTEGGSTQLVVQKIGTAEQSVTVTLSTQEGTADS